VFGRKLRELNEARKLVAVEILRVGDPFTSHWIDDFEVTQSNLIGRDQMLELRSF
jgi:hypothetical protein